MNEIQQHKYQYIDVDVSNKIVCVTMNVPDKRNALSIAHMEELTHCFKLIGSDKSLSVIILKGNGPSFCAGHDLKELVGKSLSFYNKVFEVCTNMMNTIQKIPQPVIAQVHGTATAAGCQLVATCDLAIASEEAKFATPGVLIGLFCSTPMVATSRNIHRKKMMEMLLTGESISANEALVCGLVNYVVSAVDLNSSCIELAERISNHSALVVGIGKEAFYNQLDMAQKEAYLYAQKIMVENAGYLDAQEGICAFLEKRQPEWQQADQIE